MPAAHHASEQVIAIYKCLCDANRLRILNLLRTGSQCVCHIEQVLGIGAVRTSQQLAYLRRHAMVEVEIRGTWRMYALPATPSPQLSAHLACLQDCIFENSGFRDDLAQLKKIRRSHCGPQPI
ncbi:MAG: winged helix-turn-helix transcriptional regulator [Verrucomicrobia bacterium]|nr:MAG: winged helix-turn-helix transcriptional regulator [Verrucomicrobiota bacterium]